MVSIEARAGVTTGISAADRARTIAVAVDPAARGEDLVQPGHVFPLRARPGGVLEREGRVEAAVDLATAAGLRSAAVLCQVMRDDGRMARDEDLERFAERHGLATVRVSEVVAHRRGLSLARAAAELPDPGQQMRDVMGHFATGVTVVTARAADGTAVGTTANAISSVSLRPPLLLACLAESSETLAAIRATGNFAINVLGKHQRDHSDRFAAKGADTRAHEVGFEDHPLGVPVLPDSLATIACELEAIHPAGDHEIVVGLARSLSRAEAVTEPLLFYRGSYSELTLEEDELAA
jgi:flavin reductase (DIM6/NTAB) family NADH-FMN oxidoreductase RutF